MAHIMKLEEKRSDVNIATAMLWDAFQNDVDMLVLISGDSDFIGPIELIRHKLGKQVVVFNHVYLLGANVRSLGQFERGAAIDTGRGEVI